MNKLHSSYNKTIYNTLIFKHRNQFNGVHVYALSNNPKMGTIMCMVIFLRTHKFIVANRTSQFIVYRSIVCDYKGYRYDSFHIHVL